MYIFKDNIHLLKHMQPTPIFMNNHSCHLEESSRLFQIGVRVSMNFTFHSFVLPFSQIYHLEEINNYNNLL